MGKDKKVDWQAFLDKGGFAYLKENGWSPEDVYPDGGRPRELYEKWLRGDIDCEEPHLTMAGVPASETWEELSYRNVPGYSEWLLRDAPKHFKRLGVPPERIRDDVQRARYIKFLEDTKDD